MGRHKMHPDDVNARDWEFMLSERFPEVPRMTIECVWTKKGLDWLSPTRKDDVAHARAALVNAWPNELEGETLAPFVERLEKAFEPRNTPAVSSELRGDSEKEAQTKGTRQADKVLHPYGTTPSGLIAQVRVEHERYYRDNGIQMPSAQQRHDEAEIEARKRWPHLFSGGLPPRERAPSKAAKLATLKLRARRSHERFERGGMVGVKLLSADPRWKAAPGTVMTLTESELWLDHFEKNEYDDAIKSNAQKIISAFGIPETRFPL